MTEEQKQQIARVLNVGCPLETAADMVSVPLQMVYREVDCDREFAELVLSSTAGAELTHMKNLKNASNDEKNWRASVWWLERCAPEKYAQRDARSIAEGQFNRFVGDVVEVIAQEVHDSNLLERIVARVGELVQPSRTNLD